MSHEMDIGTGDSSECLPSWISTFESARISGNGYLLSCSAIDALLHMLYAAKYRAARLVHERNEARKEIR